MNACFGMSWIGLSVTLMLGCGRGPDSPFAGAYNEPVVPVDFEDVHAICQIDSQGNPSSALHVASGHLDQSKTVWSKGGGCVHRPIRQVWAVTHNQGVMRWEDTHDSGYQQLDVPSDEVSHYYRVWYKAGPAVFRQSWEMDWFHSITQGTMESPEIILINYQKVNGTRYIRNWKGSIILLKMTDQITAYWRYEEIDASQTDESDSKESLGQILQKLRTVQPNWTPIESMELD